jgi:hypothetical protein
METQSPYASHHQQQHQQPQHYSTSAAYAYQPPPSNGNRSASPAAARGGAPPNPTYQQTTRGWAPGQGAGGSTLHAPVAQPHPNFASSASSHSHPRSPLSTPMKATPAYPAAASAQPAGSGANHAWDNMSLEALAAEHEQRVHTLSVLSSRLAHCMDGGDADGASRAAHDVTEEKKLVREIGILLTWRKSRAASEQKIRDQITQRFSSEKSTVQKHRKEIEAIKRRLRMAFSVTGPNGAPMSDSPTHSSPSSPAPSSSPSASSGSDGSVSDLIGRLINDVGKHSVLLERQNFQVDATELQLFVDMAQAQEAKEQAAAAPGGPASSAEHESSFSPMNSSMLQWSEDLTAYFKSSRKDVVKILQDLQDEADNLKKHLKATEQFMEYLRQQ